MNRKRTFQPKVDTLIKKIDHLTKLLETAPSGQNESFSDYLGAKEAADYLKVSKSTLYNLVHRRVIPCRKRGKRLYFNRLELREVIESGRRRTLSELQSFADEKRQSLYKSKK